MPRALHFVGPWDLSVELPCVPDTPKKGPVVFVESVEKSRALPFHRQKLTLILAAMHHFAHELRQKGLEVEVVRSRNYVSGIEKSLRKHRCDALVLMRPREWGIDQRLQVAIESNAFGVPVQQFDAGGEGRHFFLTRDEFAEWAEGRKQIRMHHFYAWMRKRTGYLMQDGKPVGGKYSFDTSNRKHARGKTPPRTPKFQLDKFGNDAVARVENWPAPTWGSLERFDWPYTRKQALAELDDFFDHRAANFGMFQDAMLEGETFMWHTRISAAMNVSLLSPREVCDRVQAAYDAGSMPIEAAEGLIRQILGWREYIRGMYWLNMPNMRDANALDAHNPLPDFYWEPSKTDMRCMRDALEAVEQHGYAHHIQRLMVLGNYALLAGVEPLEVSHWFWAAYVDAYEWVQLPNVHGMALYADTSFTTKPYAASGNYIDKMSNHCKGCRYDVKARHGEDACPFNSLFWDFTVRHKERLSSNRRTQMLLKTWEKFEPEEQKAIRSRAESIIESHSVYNHRWSFEDDAG